MTALPERLAQRVMEDHNGCLVWQGAISTAGYGRVGDSAYTHRVAYEHAKGPIPDGLHIDHLCRNRACCNPEHLEAVTPRENLLRSPRWMVTECPYGHEYSEENTYITPSGTRQCRKCSVRRAIEAKRARRIADGYRSRKPNVSIPRELHDEVRTRRAAGETQRSLALEFGVSETQIYSIEKGLYRDRVPITACRRGHEFTEENTRLYQGRRYCRQCRRERAREKRAAA